MKIFSPPNHLESIEEMWAFVSVDETGEGVCAARIRGAWLPMVAADMKRVGDLISIARNIATETGSTIKLIKFSVREDIMDIKPCP